MDTPSSLIHVIIGAVVAAIGQYLVTLLLKRKERKEKRIRIECVKLVNERRSIEDVFGPMAGRVQVKIPKEGPDSELIEINEWYYLKFRFRNLSNFSVSMVSLTFNKSPVWFKITEGGRNNPDWEIKLRKLLKEKMDLGVQGFICFIPYISPYRSTKHEVFLELASYIPLTDSEVGVGVEGNVEKEVIHDPCKSIKTKKIPVPKIRLCAQ